MAPFRTAAAYLRRRWNRLRGRRGGGFRIEAKTGEDVGGGADRALASVTFPELRPRTTALEAIPELDRRTRRLADLVGVAEANAHARMDEMERKREELDRTLRAEVDRLSGQDRQVATSGLRTQADGLLLIGAGLMLQALGFVLVPN